MLHALHFYNDLYSLKEQMSLFLPPWITIMNSALNKWSKLDQFQMQMEILTSWYYLNSHIKCVYL